MPIFKAAVAAGAATFYNRHCDGRLTLTTAVPVTTTDVTGATTVYFTPYLGNHLSLYTSSAWTDYTFSEISIALGTLVSASNYDVFAYDVAGVATLKLGPAWTSDTARGAGAGTTELVLQDGVLVNNVAITSGPGAKAGRYLGTFRTTSTTTTEDSKGGTTTQVGGKRFLWNMYNRVPRPLAVIDTTDSWSYTTGTWRQANTAAGNKVEWIVGQVGDPVDVRVDATANLGSNSLRAAKVGVGINSITAPSGLVAGGYVTAVASANVYLGGQYRNAASLGYSYGAWLENGADVQCVFDGDDGGDGRQSGLTALVAG